MKETVAGRWATINNRPQPQNYICPVNDRRRLVDPSALPLKLIAHLCIAVIREVPLRLVPAASPQRRC